MKPSIVISDVCDTLFYSNTTFDFITRLAGARGDLGSKAFLSLLRLRISPLNAILILLNRMTHRDYFRVLGVRLLRGYRQEDLESLAQDFLTAHLLQRPVREVLHSVLDHKRAGDRVILASSSIEPVISAIARHFDFEYVASKLEFRKGIATGRLVRELTGRKIGALTEFGIAPPYDVVITDNLSDERLLSMAKEKVIVVHSKADERRWNVPGARLIRV